MVGKYPIVESVMPRGKTRKTAVKQLSGKQIAVILSRQRFKKLVEREQSKATKAVSSFRTRKADRGHIVFVSLKGKRNPQSKGKKGFLVYVTKTGKKRLVKEYGEKRSLPRKISEFNIQNKKYLQTPIKEFQAKRKMLVSTGKAQVKGKGKAAVKGAYDFSDKIVKKIARNIQKTMSAQRAKRVFNIAVNVLIRLPDGSTQTIAFEVPIARPDHVAIRLGGIENFVRQKFYAFMAQQLAFLGYVTSGSANHIRRLADNQGADREDWVDKNGEPWRGADNDVVHILEIQWQIEQTQ